MDGKILFEKDLRASLVETGVMEPEEDEALLLILMFSLDIYAT